MCRTAALLFPVVLLLVCSVVSAQELPMTWAAHRARSQRAAVSAIQLCGGTVLYDYHESGPRSWSTAGKPSGPEWLREALGPEYFDRVVYVELFKTPDDPSWIEAVNLLGSVKTLLLSGPHVNDQMLSRLNGSPALAELHLTGASITDEALRDLARFPNLRWLVLNNTAITDKGVVHLAELKSLEDVNLNKTQVSDASIPVFVGLRHLQKLDLRRTSVTKEGAEKMRQQVPTLRVLQ